MRVRFPPNLLEDGQIGKAPGSELGNFIGSTPIPRIKAKAVPILYNLGFLFYTARFFFTQAFTEVDKPISLQNCCESFVCSNRTAPEYKNA